MAEQISTNISQQSVITNPTISLQSAQKIPVIINQPINIEVLQNLTKPITVNGEIINFSIKGDISLNTDIGKIDIIITKPDNNFFESLNNSKTDRKPPIKLFIQSGSPAKEAFIIIPKTKITEKQEINQSTFIKKTNDIPFTKGQKLSLVPIPKEIDEKTLIQKTTKHSNQINIKNEPKTFKFVQTIKENIETFIKEKPVNKINTQTKINQYINKSIGKEITKHEKNITIKTTEQKTHKNTKIIKKDKGETSIIVAQKKETVNYKKINIPLEKKQIENEETKITFKKSLGQEVKYNKEGIKNNTNILRKITNQSEPTLIKIDDIIKPEKNYPKQIKPEQIRSEIIGKTLSGQTIIKSEGKSFVILNKGTLEKGTKLISTILNTYKDQNLPTRSPTDQKIITNIENTIIDLNKISPKSAQNFISQNIPSPQQNMTATLLFLFSAIQGNKIEEWIGISRLAKIKTTVRKKITDNLKQSFNEKGSPVHDSHSSEWKSWLIPIMNENNMDSLKFYIKDDDNYNENEKENIIYTRFIISMNMSHLGHMQLDGLSKKGNLDLIVRSENKLPKTLLAEIKQTASKIYDATGLKGSIKFQENSRNWINFKEEENKDLKVEI